MSKIHIAVSQPYINKPLALRLLEEVLESGQLAQGPSVALAEEELVKTFQASHAALYANGTASLRGALIASLASATHDEQHVDRYIRNKEVIIPAFSFNATLNTVLDSGAKARIVDIDENSFTIHPDHAASVIGDTTIAIMPVDLYGQPADILRTDPRFDSLLIIRDAAQAHGATISGDPLTTHGDAVSLSFYPTKNIAAPEGGVILTNNSDIDRIARIYRNQGMSAPYQYDMIGDNLRMSDIHAAILRANIDNLAHATTRRRENAALLSKELADIEGLITPTTTTGMSHVWHQYTIRIDSATFGMDRDKLKLLLAEAGIGTGIYYPKIMTDYTTFTDHPMIITEPTPIAKRVARQVLSLPVHPGVTTEDIYYIVEAIKAIQKRGSSL